MNLNENRRIQVRMAGAIVVAREQAGMSQAELAEHLGIKPQRLSTYESATRKVPVTLLPRLSKILNRPIGYFFSEPDPRGLSEDEQGIVCQLRSIESPGLRANALDSIRKQLQAILETDRSLRERATP